MRGMTVDEYLPKALAMLDAEPASRLAISLDNLNRADDRYMIGLDLITSFIRKANPAALTRGQNHDIARFRRAADIIGGRLLLGSHVTYRNVRSNINFADGRIRDLATDGEARQLVARLVEAEPVLAWLVADRYDQKILERDPGHRGGPNLEDHLADIEQSLDSDPAGRLAVSLENLSGADSGHRLGIGLVMDYVRGVDPDTLGGQLATDVARFQRALGILAEEITLGGLTFHNLRANVRDMMGNLSNFATTTEARDLAMRITAAVPDLAASITIRDPEIPF